MMRLWALAALPLLAGCTASGTGLGQVKSAGRTSGEARFAWTSRGGATAELEAWLPDGEHFSGTALSRSLSTEPTPMLLFGHGKDKPALLVPTTSRSWTGAIRASLAGDRGRSMMCDLVARRPALGLEGGAQGRCIVSDGSIIDARL